MAGADNRKPLSILRAIHFAETAAATLPSQIASGKPISGWVYMRIENNRRQVILLAIALADRDPFWN